MGLCQLGSWARYINGRLIGSNLAGYTGITSELQCFQTCVQNYPTPGSWQSFVYLPGNDQNYCWVLSNAATAATNQYGGFQPPTAGWVTILYAPSCLTYSGVTYSEPCEMVVYPNSGLIRLDGAPAVCMDNFAITCDSAGRALTCLQFFTVMNGLCQPTSFARYPGYDNGGNDWTQITSVPSDTACQAACILATNGHYNTGYSGASWDFQSTKCFCKVAGLNAWKTFAPNIDVSLILGTCATFASLIPSYAGCQSVSFVTGSCVTTDGSGACWAWSCNDSHATACDPANKSISKACAVNYLLYNNVCVLVYARYVNTDEQVNDAAGTMSGNENYCSSYCNGYPGFVFGVGNGCHCKPSQAVSLASMNPSTLWIASLMGPCQLYSNSILYSCQNVMFSGGNACIGYDGTPCVISMPTGSNKACTDPNALTCDSLHPANSLLCGTNYYVYNYNCVLMFSRFLSMAWYGGDLTSGHISVSATDCFAWCTSQAPSFATFLYDPVAGGCGCKTAVTSANAWSTIGAISYLRGTCNSFSYLPTACQNVVFSPTTGCLAINGTACASYDINAATSSPSTELSITCKQYYTAVNGVCQPVIFAKYYNYDLQNSDLSNHGGSSSTSSEIACVALCVSSAGINSSLMAASWISNFNCSCKTFSKTAVLNGPGNSGEVTLIIGTCLQYASQFMAVPCKTVTYASGSCMQTNGLAC